MWSQLQRISLSHRNDDDGSEEEGEEKAERVEVELKDFEEEIDLKSGRVNDSGGAELFAPENTVIVEKQLSQNHLLWKAAHHDHFKNAL